MFALFLLLDTVFHFFTLEIILAKNDHYFFAGKSFQYINNKENKV